MGQAEFKALQPNQPLELFQPLVGDCVLLEVERFETGHVGQRRGDGVGQAVVLEHERLELGERRQMLQSGVRDPSVPEVERFEFGECLQFGKGVVVRGGFAQVQPP